MGDHPRVGVDQHQLDPRPCQRHREPTGAGAQVEDRPPDAVGERKPGLEVGGVRQPAVELRETWIGIAGVVPDGFHLLECRLDGEVLTAVILIKASREGLRTLGPQLADVEGVSEVYTVTGEWDFVAMVRVREHEELARVVTTGLARLDGIEKTNTMVAFQQFSSHDLEAMFGLGMEA